MRSKFAFIAFLILLGISACHRTETNQPSPASFEKLSEQGRSLCRKGNYIEGMALLLTAKDSMASMHPDSVNPEGAVKLRGNIANLYTRMGLYDEARIVNSEAIAIAEKKAPYFLPDLWRMRSMLYHESNDLDSELVCLRKYIELDNSIPVKNPNSSRARIPAREYLYWFFIENPDYAPDSIPMALAALESIYNVDRTQYISNTSLNTTLFLIGRAHVLIGNYQQGIPIMQKALATFKENGDLESLEWGLQLLAKSYAQAKDRRLLDIYDEASSLHDTIMQRKRDNNLLGMDFRYRTSQLESEKTILQHELQAKRQRIIFLSLISILIVAGLVTFIIMRYRNNKRQLELKQQNISNLLTERIALNSRIEELNHMLADRSPETKHCGIFQTILLDKEDEQRFRKNFNDLHPGFINRLRHDYPDLTSGNELLCMLIALNRRNEEIALALGISRESVATSRYRLRNRFNLSKDIDLNKFIQSRL